VSVGGYHTRTFRYNSGVGQERTMKPVPFPFGFGSATLTSRRGRRVHVRHIRPDDDALLVELFGRLSEETRRMRFFSPLPDLPDAIIWREAHRLADIDPVASAALVATVEEEGRERAVGVARLGGVPRDPEAAEPAIVLRDDYQGEGIGTALFDLLVQVAMVRGYRRLRAISLAENVAVQRLIARLGLPFASETRRGETTTVIELGEPTAR
jgi:acetyltransferase